ncbi:hypothetical protein TRFO_04555 [Tritrichomonas foetus]|uniref:Guanylate-binding protein N-terminal domain-containing protein n=1 Tax=Tritrichomonas foetus TaxID=1144522 RepID=A0A1J4KDG3_9EUKA|nr:hypothetical protein TRFO_04555 [Tritrichomonas foetus]|eukprot:OHT09473.1 hypothetical protein TRFO_04555 [Tritrichomonas foetus]
MSQSKPLFNDDLTLTSDFQNLLEKSKNPIIITFFGIYRAGKSTRANQLITGIIDSSKPFETDDGSDSITQGCHFCGPLKMNQLLPNHNDSVSLNKDADIFIVDCEGLHDIKGNQSGNIRKMTIILLQISTIITYVSKDIINYINVNEIRDFFGISKIIPGGGIQYETGFTIMVRDVGIKGAKGLSEDEVNIKRREQDQTVKGTMINILKDNHIVYNDRNFQVLYQPNFPPENLYFQSMKDYMNFVGSIINMRDEIPGKLLVKVADNVRPIINRLTNLNNPNINSTDLYNQVIENIIEQAMVDVTHEINKIPSYIQNQLNNNHTHFNVSSYTSTKCSQLKNLFTQNCTSQLKKIESFDCYQRKLNSIDSTVKNTISSNHTRFYQDYVIPKESQIIKNKQMQEITRVVNNSSSSDLRSIDSNVDNWIKKFVDPAVKSLESTVIKQCSNAKYSSKLEQCINSIRTDLTNHARQKFRDRCNECPPYPSTVSEARRSGQTGSYVTLWNGKSSSHTWRVDSSDNVYIKVTAQKYRDVYGYTSEGICYSTRDYCIDLGTVITSFNYRTMELRVHGGSLDSSQTRYKHGLGRGHYTAKIERIEITINDDLYFQDGKKNATISGEQPSYKVYPVYCSRDGDVTFRLRF